MATTSTADDSPKATLVFQGTVKKIKAATMKNVSVDDRTAVVHVDQVLESPPNLRHLAGSDITVQLTERAAVNQSLLFHAAGWVFGDSIAVRAVTQEPIQRSHAPLLARGGDPAEHLAQRALKERVDSADLVVSGTVVAVRLPEGSEPVAGATRGATAVNAKPVSEHDPKWREAIVEVADVHKGDQATKRVSVLFPASIDVRWFKAPKFHAGQQGYFILHKQTIDAADRVDVRTRGAAVSAGPPEPVEVYTALSPDDVHPYQQQERLRGLIDVAPTTRGEKEE
jgi:hypothetical protein